MAPSCCGGSAANAILAAKKATGQIPSDEPAAPVPGPSGTITESATVRMAFTGEEQGPVTFWGNNGRFYRGANTALNKFANVHPSDVERLEATGAWRRIGGSEERAEAAVAPTRVMSEAERRAAAEAALLAARAAFAAQEPAPEAQELPVVADEPPAVVVAPQEVVAPVVEEKPRKRIRIEKKAE